MNENIYWADLLDKDTEDLYAKLGEELNEIILSASPKSKPDLIIEAKEWIISRREELQDLICPNAQIQSFIKSPDVDRRVQIVAIIADILGQSYLQFTPFTLSVLLLKESLMNLCHPEAMK